MKFIFNWIFVLFLAVISQKSIAKSEADFKEIQKQCHTEHNIPESEFENFLNNSMDKTNVDKEFKCFLHCVLKKMDYLDENDKLDADKLKNRAESFGIQSEIISDCKAMHDLTEDPCEYTFDMFTCVMT